MPGNENGMLYYREIIGVAYIAVHALPRFTTRDMQNGTSAKNRLIGSSRYANHVMTLGITKEPEII